jgi:hypothetical protein
MFAAPKHFSAFVPLQPKGRLYILVEGTRYYVRLAYPQKGVWTSLTGKIAVTHQDLNRLITHNSQQHFEELSLTPQGATVHVAIENLPPLYGRHHDIVGAIDKAILHVKALMTDVERQAIKEASAKQ